MGKTPPGGKSADGERKGDDAIEKILDQARKEGVRVTEPDSPGSGSGDGIAQILRQLGAENP